MARIELFCEDAAHESCARALVRRCGDEEQVAVGVHVAAARFGIPRLKRELGAFQAVVRQRAGTPDILVVLIDANRVGVAGRRGEVEDALEPGLFPHVVIGTPDPCVERWLLADPPSFTQLYGREPDVSVFIAAIGIILRGTSYALRAGEPGPREEGALSVVFALSSILTPFALGAALGGIASGRVPVGNAGGEPFGSWINPTSLLVGVLAVVSAAYLAAVNLAGDARRAQLPEMASLFRARALRAGGLLGGLAVAGPLVLHADARPLYDGLSSGGGLVAGFVSGAAGVTALALVYRGRFDLARGSAALAVTAIIAGWALAQQPFLLPGLTLEEAAAGHSTLVAIAVAAVIGFVVLAPSLAILFRLVLRGRFDPGEEEPVTERVTGPPHPARIVKPPVVVATVGLGAAVSLLADGWLLGVGVAAMLAGATLAFLLLAAPEQES